MHNSQVINSIRTTEKNEKVWHVNVITVMFQVST